MVLVLDSGGWRSSVVTPFLLIVDPALQVIDRVADASPEADVGNLAGCGHPPQLPWADRQGLGSLLGCQQ
jgi:hypothetical protein